MSRRIDVAAIKRAAALATKGPWVTGRSHAETKDAMIAYVINCIEVSPLPDQFFLVGTKDWDADVCHTGNGPTSEQNGHYLALCDPATILALVATTEELSRVHARGNCEGRGCQSCLTLAPFTLEKTP